MSAFEPSRIHSGKYQDCCNCNWNTMHYDTANFKTVLAFVPLQAAKSTRPFESRSGKRLHFAAHFQNSPVGYSEYLSRIMFRMNAYSVSRIMSTSKMSEFGETNVLLREIKCSRGVQRLWFGVRWLEKKF